MTIIEEMREAADNPDVYEHNYPSIIARWADTLESSGALVPVKVGEVCERRRTPLDLFEFADEVYIEIGGNYRPKRLIDGEPDTVLWSAPVQPVRLVAITEWEGE